MTPMCSIASFDRGAARTIASIIASAVELAIASATLGFPPSDRLAGAAHDRIRRRVTRLAARA
jgi:hypothetical protein